MCDFLQSCVTQIHLTWLDLLGLINLHRSQLLLFIWQFYSWSLSAVWKASPELNPEYHVRHPLAWWRFWSSFLEGHASCQRWAWVCVPWRHAPSPRYLHHDESRSPDWALRTRRGKETKWWLLQPLYWSDGWSTAWWAANNCSSFECTTKND